MVYLTVCYARYKCIELKSFVIIYGYVRPVSVLFLKDIIDDSFCTPRTNSVEVK